MIRQIVLLIFAVVVVRCHGNNVHLENNRLDGGIEGGYKVTEINLNRWFDSSLPLIKKYMVEHGLEPMSIPAMSLPVLDMPGFKRTIELNNGIIHGISNVSRSGDIIQRVYQNSYQVVSLLNWKDVKLNYDYSMKYLFSTRKGTLTGSTDLSIDAMSIVDVKARKVELQYLKIIDAGNFSVKLSGHLADTVANAAMKAMTVVFMKRMLREMEHEMTIVTQLKIKQLNDWLAKQTSMPEMTNAFLI